MNRDLSLTPAQRDRVGDILRDTRFKVMQARRDFDHQRHILFWQGLGQIRGVLTPDQQKISIKSSRNRITSTATTHSAITGRPTKARRRPQRRSLLRPQRTRTRGRRPRGVAKVPPASLYLSRSSPQASWTRDDRAPCR